ESVPVEVHLVQRRLRAVHAVQVCHTSLESALQRILEQVPIDAPGLTPFVALAEVQAHEQKLLARVSKHVRVQQAQRCKLLPGIARDLVQHTALAVYHLVVRQAQNEVFATSVQQAE